MEQLAGLKEFLGIMVVACSLISTGATLAGFYVLTNWRLKRIESVLFDVGGLLASGAQREARLDTIEALCKERHEVQRDKLVARAEIARDEVLARAKVAEMFEMSHPSITL